MAVPSHVLTPTHVRTPRKGASKVGFALVLAAATACALHAGTQYMAFALGFDPRLGGFLIDARDVLPWRLLALGFGVAALICLLTGRRWAAAGAGALDLLCVDLALGPLYAPHQVLVWSWHLRGAPGFEGLLMEVMVCGFAGGMTVLLVGYYLVRRPFPLPTAPKTLGSAHFGTETSLLGSQGVVLGLSSKRSSKSPSKRSKRSRSKRSKSSRSNHLLRYNEEGHLLTVAPSGAGKGVGPIISTLLDYPGSLICTDPKSENFFVTHRRRQRMGHHVVALDPFRVVEQIGRRASVYDADDAYDELTYEAACGAFNPLALIDPQSEEAIDVARTLAEMIVAEEGDRQDATSVYFNKEARATIAGLLLFVAAHRRGPERSLPGVRRLLCQGPREFKAFLNEEMTRTSACHGEIRAAANRLRQKADREYGGVVSSMHHHTHFLDSPAIQRTLTHSSFHPDEIRRRRLSLYLILPPHRVDAYAAYQRVMIQCFFTALSEGPPPTKAPRTLFLLDEFANLGKLDSVVRALTLMRGYGAQIWMFVQNLPDLKKVYGRAWKSLLDVNVLQTFGTNDHETATHLSAMLGHRTVYAAGRSANRSAGGKRRGRGRSLTYTERQRPLLAPDEIRRLDEDKQLLFVRGEAPIGARKLRYFEHPVLCRRAGPNPFHAGPAKGSPGAKGPLDAELDAELTPA